MSRGGGARSGARAHGGRGGGGARGGGGRAGAGHRGHAPPRVAAHASPRTRPATPSARPTPRAPARLAKPVARPPAPKPKLSPKTKPKPAAKPKPKPIPKPTPKPKLALAARPKPSNGSTKGVSRAGPLIGVKKGQQVGVPARGVVTSAYGPRMDPKSGKASIHKGIDIAMPVGTPVKATGGGKVIRSGWQNSKDHHAGYGERIAIDHGNGNVTEYGHLSRRDVKTGDIVKNGQTIARSGNTGKSTGPHLHYSELRNGVAHPPTGDPEHYVAPR